MPTLANLERFSMNCWFVSVTGLFILVAQAGADAPARTHDITLEDYFSLAFMHDGVLSPDGRSVAFTEGRWQQNANDNKTDLLVAATQTGAVRRLTADRGGDSSPEWSPDGRWIYFAGRRNHPTDKLAPYNGKPQVWRIPFEGGKAVAVTRAEGGVHSYHLAPDGKAVYVLTSTETIDGDWKAMKERHKNGIEYGHGVTPYSQIWKIDLPTGRGQKLIDNHRVIRDFAVSPDDRRIAMITTPDEKVVSFEGQSRVDVFDTSSGRTITLPDRPFHADALSPYGWLENLGWSADGEKLAFNVIFDAYPTEIIVAEWSSGEPQTARLQRPEGVMVRGYGSPVHWRGATDLCFVGESRGRSRLCCVKDVHAGRQGALEVWTPGDVVAESFTLAPQSGTAVVLMNGQTHMPDLFLVEPGNPPRRLTNANPQVETWKLPQISVVSWKGAHGDEVEGILELPPGYQPGRKLPLVVDIHGGPTSANYFHLQYSIYGRTLLPARGYAVLSPNYRGSTGYGDKFLTDLIGRENDIEVEDILKGVDAMIERGIADPARLGVMGWSNGGYLTNCVITKTTRFKAASSGAGIADMVMEWGANDEPAYTIIFRSGFPWNQAESYRKTSPVYEFDKIRTPTLIHVGGSDERCIPGHSKMLYRALKEYVKVPTELLVYTGEPHGLQKYSSRKAKMEWDLAWFEKYLR